MRWLLGALGGFALLTPALGLLFAVMVLGTWLTGDGWGFLGPCQGEDDGGRGVRDTWRRPAVSNLAGIVGVAGLERRPAVEKRYAAELISAASDGVGYLLKTRREWEVLAQMAEGCTNSTIGNRLHVSQSAVENPAGEPGEP